MRTNGLQAGQPFSRRTATRGFDLRFDWKDYAEIENGLFSGARAGVTRDAAMETQKEVIMASKSSKLLTSGSVNVLRREALRQVFERM